MGTTAISIMSPTCVSFLGLGQDPDACEPQADQDQLRGSGETSRDDVQVSCLADKCKSRIGIGCFMQFPVWFPFCSGWWDDPHGSSGTVWPVVGLLLHQNIYKFIFDDGIAIKVNAIQIGLSHLFLLSLKEIKTHPWDPNLSRMTGDRGQEGQGPQHKVLLYLQRPSFLN